MDNYHLVFVFCCVLLFFENKYINCKTVQTKYGLVEGTTLISRNGTHFNAFYGIRFAEAPEGYLRFQPPIPKVNPWNNTLNATKQASKCSQIGSTSKYEGIEDCLYVDIYSPLNSKPGDNIPVIVYLFGGAYIKGSTYREGPEFIMNSRIILVKINARLHVLGFFVTDDNFISGNMGLKDQSLGLLWVKENIHSFGGDPNRITLVGDSSGSSSVHLHTYSPLSKGLFQRVILLSGFVLSSPNNFCRRDVMVNLSKTLAKSLKCLFKSSHKIVDCLNSKTAKEITEHASKSFLFANELPGVSYCPIVETENTIGAFISKPPSKSSPISEEIPWILGMTSSEGALDAGNYFYNYHDWPSNPQLLFPLMLPILWSSKPQHLNYVSKIIYKHFFGHDLPINESSIAQLVELLTGFEIGYPLLQTLKSGSGLKYVYVFDYKPSYYLSVVYYPKFIGVGHADDLYVYFNISQSHFDFPQSDNDIIFGDELLRRWINFAYSGNPNKPFPIDENILAHWKPMSSHHMEFLHLNLQGQMDKDYFKERFGFWNKMPVYSEI